MFLLTTVSQKNGAIGICYPEILQSLADIFKSDYFIIPSSIHECIIIPFVDNMTITDINKMIVYVNTHEVLPEEFLSNHVYQYDYKTKKIVSIYTK